MYDEIAFFVAVDDRCACGWDQGDRWGGYLVDGIRVAGRPPAAPGLIRLLHPVGGMSN